MSRLPWVKSCLHPSHVIKMHWYMRDIYLILPSGEYHCKIPQISSDPFLTIEPLFVNLHVMLLLVGTTSGWIRGCLTMSCQWMVSAWHRKLLRSTYTPPFKISVETREAMEREGSVVMCVFLSASLGWKQTKRPFRTSFQMRTDERLEDGVNRRPWEKHITWWLLYQGGHDKSLSCRSY